MTHDPSALTRQVVARCKSAGFALVGVCDAAPSDRADHVRDWLAAGKQGSMDWLSEHLDKRLDVTRLLEGARSIVMVGDLYASSSPPASVPAPAETPAPPAHAARGRVARYAQGDDYHRVVRARLHALADHLRAAYPGARFRSVVDIVPFAEREHAARAGLGWVGKHTLLINPDLGSWFVLGGLATTLHLPPLPEHAPAPDACGTCTRCIDACPTSAITPYSVDASRCISYLTVERRLPIDDAFYPLMGDWLFGCDVCQDVCPHNRPRPADHNRPETNPAYAPRHTTFDLRDILNWTPPDRAVILTRSALKRATLVMWKRNALIVAGNALARAPDHALFERVNQIAADPGEPDILRHTAARVVQRLREASTTA